MVIISQMRLTRQNKYLVIEILEFKDLYYINIEFLDGS